MVLAELLEAIGAPGAVVVAVMVMFGLYHFREALTLASVAGTYLYIMAFVVGALVIAEAGLVPGVELNVTGQFFDLLGNTLATLWDGAKETWGVIA